MSSTLCSRRRPPPWKLGLLLVLIGTLGAAFFSARSDSWSPECYASNVCDSLTFRTVGELLRDGRTPYDAAARRHHISTTRLHGAPVGFDLPFQYPPNSLPLFAVRAWASPRTAHFAFSILTTFLCLLMSLFLVQRDMSDGLGAALLLGGVAFSGIVAFNALLGQTGVLAAALAVAAVLFWRSVPALAGVLLGVLAFKPQYAIPLAVIALVRNDRQVWLGAAASFTALCAVSGLVYGSTEWLEFLHVLNRPNHTVNFMVNWMGLAWRAAPGETLIQQAALPVFALSMLAIGGAAWLIRERAPVEAQLCTALAWVVVASPNTHPYDLLVLTPALVYVSTRGGGVLVGPLFCVLTWTLLPPSLHWALAAAGVLLAGLCSVLLGRDVARGSGSHTAEPLCQGST